MLQAEVRLLETERQRLGREVGLRSELEQGYATRGAKQQGQIRDLSARIAALEASLQRVLQDFDSERQAVTKASSAALADARAEADALRRLVLLKTRELKNIRRLAQQVLFQRSDVESFLLNSLHAVKKEVERGSLRPGNNNSSNHHTIAGGGTVNVGGGGLGATGGGLDLKELSWEDRERVLRLLFAKINNQSAQQHFANLPSHPLGEMVEVVGAGSLIGTHTDAGPAGLV